MSVALRVPDPGPMARLAVVQADESTPSVVFQRVADGETLKEIARAWGLPKGEFARWYTVEHADLYDAALKLRADELAHDALEIADEQKEATDKSGKSFDPEVPRDKLRIETRLKLASKWDRRRYGEEQESKQIAPVTIQIANLRGAPLTIEAGGAKVELPAQPLREPMLERAEPESLI